ncbi:dihydrofolate reductase [Monosporozyma servazzii]
MTISKIPVVAIVATLLPDMGIGFQGTLPWRLSKEMKYFKQVTSSTWDSNKHNAVIMGRKTWESIPARFRPLPNRLNIVISRGFSDNLHLEQIDETKSFYKINSIQAAVKELNTNHPDVERIYIIGGAEIYNASFDIVDHWLITKLQILPTEENNNMIPTMDTFLNKEKLFDEFEQADKDKLSQFVPSTVELPESNETSEKGYHFQYTMYNRK